MKWIGKTTDMRKVYVIDCVDTFKELFEAIEEKYGYGRIIHDEYSKADRENWTEEDYETAISDSDSQAYYQTIEMEEDEDE